MVVNDYFIANAQLINIVEWRFLDGLLRRQAHDKSMGRQDEVAAVDWVAIFWLTPPCTSLHSFGTASSVRYVNINFGDVEAVLSDVGFWCSGEKLGGLVERWVNELGVKEWAKCRDERVAATSEHDNSQTHTEPSAAVFDVGCLLHLLIVAWAGQPSSMSRCFIGMSRSVFWGAV